MGIQDASITGKQGHVESHLMRMLPDAGPFTSNATKLDPEPHPSSATLVGFPDFLIGSSPKLYALSAALY